MHHYRSRLGCGFLIALAGCEALNIPLGPIPTSDDPLIQSLIAPAPTLPIGHYDYFGAMKSPDEARAMLIAAGLDPHNPSHYLRLGLIHVTDQLIADGRDRFFRQPLGDPDSLGRIFSLPGEVTLGIDTLHPIDPAEDPNGAQALRRSLVLTLLTRPRLATTNVRVRLDADLRVGSHFWPAGSTIDTGLDVAAGQTLPVGVETGALSCAACHAAVDRASGQVVVGAPNSDLNIGLFLATVSNTAAAFLRFNRADIDPFDPRLPRTGRRIIDSAGASVQLPDPASFEDAVDDLVISIPRGNFEAAADATTAETRIPDVFVLGEGGMGYDGGFQIGPFGGVAALSSAVHSFEINFLGPAALSRLVADLDPEIYLGLVLQNAADPALRIPDDVRPTEWLAQYAPRPEQNSILTLPGYPAPTLFSLNGLAFSPPGETFMYTPNALAAFQQSLRVPPNRSIANRLNLASGAVLRGAGVFAAANCSSCHAPPFFTNGAITPNSIIKAGTRRATARRLFDGRLAEAVIPTFDQLVPPQPGARMLTLPPGPNATSNLVLPPGLDNPDGGYKVAGLLGLYLRAPYLHDGSIAAGSDALETSADGSYQIAAVSSIGLPGTLQINRPADAGNSLRVLLDRDLRAALLANHAADPTLARNGVEGIGHEFFVDPAAGFTYAQQRDLIAFLLALDDDPGR